MSNLLLPNLPQSPVTHIIMGNNWKAADHQKAVQLLREGKLALNENADARTLPGKAITTADIAKF